MILLILGIAWVLVLAPAFVKRVFDKKPTASIETFHHQLNLLERTGPKIVAPAYRLQTSCSETGLAPGQSGFPAISSMPGRPNLVLLGSDAEPDPVGAEFAEPAFEPDPGYRLNAPSSALDMASRPCGSARRRQAARDRRRNTIVMLGGVAVFTGLLGIVSALHPLWILTAIAGVALAGYVALMAYAQALQNERGHMARLRESGFQTAATPVWDDAYESDSDDDDGFELKVAYR